MLNAIAEGKKYILMEMYLFESGDIGNQFVKAFISAVQRGVTVQLLVDDYGSLALTKSDKKS